MSSLTILAVSSDESVASRLSKIAAWMGIPSRIIALDQIDPGAVLRMLISTANSFAAMTAGALVCLHEQSTSGRLNDHDVIGIANPILLFGFDGSERQSWALSWLTRCQVFQSIVEPGCSLTVSFPAEGEFTSKQLAGTEFCVARQIGTVVFNATTGPQGFVEIVRANSRPLFMKRLAENLEVYVLGGAEVVDIESTVSEGSELESLYHRVLPAIMFVRDCFGSRCWHSAKPVARLVIDDPLLGKRYGYLEYSNLLSSMERLDYATTIAFIPWNFWRTSRAVASRLLADSTRLSICVHGCDHTNREFHGADVNILAGKARLAMDRMRRHARRTGTPFDPIMVFPQGKFSLPALEQLATSGFIAAANSTCHPWRDPVARVPIGELLLPAVTHWGGFPIFQRQYPHQKFQCALSLFLGRPLILVEHHQYFRDGLGPLERCISELRHKEPRLSFPPIKDIVVRSCLIRYISTTAMEVQFFTRLFEFKLEDRSVTVIRLIKHEPNKGQVSAILVNGESTPFSIVDSLLFCEVQVSGASRFIRVDVELFPSGVLQRDDRLDFVYECGVLARRLLSEFRDNVLCRYELLFRVARGLARRVGLTGDSQTK